MPHVLSETDRLLPRRRAELERLARSNRPRVLMVKHAFGGGAARHVAELARSIESTCEVLILQPGETPPVTRSQYALLRWVNAGETFECWMRLADEWPRLVALLQGIGIDRMHLHHVHGLPAAVLDLPEALGCPFDVTLHDYYAICPEYHLTDREARYCGEPNGDCRKCEERAPDIWGIGIPAWRRTFAQFLGRADRVIAPSEDCAARIERYVPAVKPLVWPHAAMPASGATAAVRVVVPGALSPEKGLGVVEACARHASANALPLHFIVAGYVARPLETWPALPVTITGEYPDHRLRELIALLAPGVLFFPAQCPETFSYTLTEAMASGLPLVATDLGALPGRLASYPRARIVPWDAPAASFNAELLASGGSRASYDAQPVGPTPAEYAQKYLGPITCRAASRPEALASLDERWFHDPVEPVARPTLLQLFEDGVLCGRASSREALVDRIAHLEEDRARPLQRSASSPSPSITSSLRAALRKLGAPFR